MRCAALLGLMLAACTSPRQPPSPGMQSHHRGPRSRVLLDRFRTPLTPGDSAARALEQFVGARESQLRFCYAEMGLAADSTLSGFLHVTAWLAPTGIADSVHLRPMPSGPWSPMAGPAGVAVQRCLRSRIRSWRFPPHLGVTLVHFDAGFTWDPEPRNAPVDGHTGHGPVHWKASTAAAIFPLRSRPRACPGTG